MDEFLTVLFEGRNSVERKFVVLSNLSAGAGDDHGGEGFVGFKEILCEGVGDCDEVGFEVVGVPY